MPPDTSPLLNADEHTRMLRDIAQVSLAVAARADTARAWDDLDIAASDSSSFPCPRARLGFIQQALPALAQACEQIARAPIVDLHAETRRVSPPQRARYVSTPSLLHAVRAGHAAQWVDETCSAPTLNTPEARMTRSFLGRLRRDADTIAAIADAATLPEIAADARRCAARAQTLRTLPIWETADTPEAWTLPPTLRMQRHPALARVCAQIGHYRRAFAFDWEHPLFSLPAREQWQIYETWGMFQVLRALLTLGLMPCPGALGQPNGLLAVRQTQLTLRLAIGEASRLDLLWPDGASIALFYQRVFPAGQRSRSRTLQPDICLEDHHGTLFLLDPKYKAYLAPGDEGPDMDQMHAYRDAIVSPGGKQSVRRAWCLYAGALFGSARPLIAYGSPEASIVGALHLRPGDDRGFLRLCELLQTWLA